MNELQPQEYSNTCLDRGLLVSLRDGELNAEETRKVHAHLAVCPDCAADERSMQADSQDPTIYWRLWDRLPRRCRTVTRPLPLCSPGSPSVSQQEPP
jgi:anti-sigma factor RsiW